MARRLGEAYVQFGQRGMDKVTASSKRSVTALRGVSSAATQVQQAMRFGQALLALGALRRAVSTVSDKMKELDTVAKLARRTGFSSEAIAGLGFAAEQSGSDVATLNKTLDMFTRRMGEAATGSGEAKRFLDLMGLSAKDLVKLDADEMLAQVSEGFKVFRTTAEKAAAANAIFGRGAQALLPVLTNGRRAIDQWIAAAEDMGLGFTPEELQKVEDANDAMNELGRSVGALASIVAIKLAPTLETVADNVAGIVRAFKDWTSDTSTLAKNIQALNVHLTETTSLLSFIEDVIVGGLGPLGLLTTRIGGKGKGAGARKGPEVPPVDPDMSPVADAVAKSLSAQSGGASAIFKTTQAAILRKEDQLLAEAKKTNQLLDKIEKKPAVEMAPAVLGP